MRGIVDGGARDVLLVADGASIHTRRLLRALLERDVRAAIATFAPSGVPDATEHLLPSAPGDTRYLRGVFALAGIVARRRPAIVHAHYVSSFGLMAALALRIARSGARLVQTAWGTDLLVTSRRSAARAAMARFALGAADLVTADSADLEDEARRLAPAPRFMRFVFGPNAALLRSDGPRDPILVSMRRLDPEMRVDLVVRGFRRARQLAPDALAPWRLLVAGDGADAAVVREAAAGDGAVEIAGALAHDELRQRIVRARAQVAVPRSDATSAALLDGLAAGLLPVVNDLPATREWVDPLIGEIVPTDPTVDDVATALVRGMTRDVDRERIRDRVRAVTWEAEVDRLVAAYASL